MRGFRSCSRHKVSKRSCQKTHNVQEIRFDPEWVHARKISESTPDKIKSHQEKQKTQNQE